MKFAEIAETLNCSILHKSASFDEADIYHVAAGDLMSEVLVVDEEGFIIVTALSSDQTVRTADIVGAAGIILVNGKPPQRGMRELAADTDITLLSTPLSLFRVCYLLGTLLEESS